MKLFYIGLLFFFTLPAFSQQPKKSFDSRLQAVFELDYLLKVNQTNPILIKRWTFYLDNSFYLADYHLSKFPKNLPEITIPDLKNVNILKIEKEQKTKKKWDVPIAYKIKNTQKILVYHSGKQFNEAFREWKIKN